MSKFGQYQLFDRIAIGGMAEIFRGRAAGEEGFEKQVAIKRILPSYARDGRFVSMLVTEARIHSALTHRNIVQIHDLGVAEDGEYFIVLEYVDGHDLGALLARLAERRSRGSTPAQLSDAVALYIAIELGEGIHFAHELNGADGQTLGLIHRDISPSNVLLSYAGEVKLSDFGLAKRRTDHSVVGSLKGKLAYMSPEQAKRAPIDRRSDLFALGAVLYEMLTGHPLREIEDSVAGWQQVASGLVAPARRWRPDLAPGIDHLLARALEPDPRDRFADVRAFVNEARTALDEQPRSRLGEAGELQSLLKALLPPGTGRPTRPASRVIRLQSEMVNTDSVYALGSDETVPGTDLASNAQNESPAAAVEDPSVTAVAPTPATGEGAAAPRPVAPAAMLEWPRHGPPPPPIPSAARLPGGRAAGLTGAPSAPGARPAGGAAVDAATGAGPSAGDAGPLFGALDPAEPRLGQSLPSVAGLIDRRDQVKANPVPPPVATNDDRIIAAWPSLLSPALAENGTPALLSKAGGPGTPGASGTTPGGKPADLSPGAAARPAPRGAEGTPPLGGASPPGTPAPPPTMPPFPPAPSAPGPVRSAADAGLANPRATPPFLPPGTAAGGPNLGQRREDYPAAAGTPVFYAPPPPPRKPRGERGADGYPRRRKGMSPGSVLAAALVLTVLAAGAAAVVHVLFVPLEVLLVWQKPAQLQIRSYPAGAEVLLDGELLAGRTPIVTDVTRDRKLHHLEVRQEGFAVETRELRYDRTVRLEESLALHPEIAPGIEPIRAPQTAPSASAPPATAPGLPAPSSSGPVTNPSAPTSTARSKAAEPGRKVRKKSRGKSKPGRGRKPAGSTGQRSSK